MAIVFTEDFEDGTLGDFLRGLDDPDPNTTFDFVYSALSGGNDNLVFGETIVHDGLQAATLGGVPNEIGPFGGYPYDGVVLKYLTLARFDSFSGWTRINEPPEDELGNIVAGLRLTVDWYDTIIDEFGSWASLDFGVYNRSYPTTGTGPEIQVTQYVNETLPDAVLLGTTDWVHVLIEVTETSVDLTVGDYTASYPFVRPDTPATVSLVIVLDSYWPDSAFMDDVQVDGELGLLGRLKVWSEADEEWLWQGAGSMSGVTGLGRFKVWDGDEWRIAEPVAGESVTGRLKVYDGTGWRTTIPG